MENMSKAGLIFWLLPTNSPALCKTAGVCSNLNRCFMAFCWLFLKVLALLSVCVSVWVRVRGRWQKVNGSTIMALQKTSMGCNTIISNNWKFYLFLFYNKTSDICALIGSTTMWLLRPPCCLAAYWLSEEAGQLAVPEAVGACPCSASTAHWRLTNTAKLLVWTSHICVVMFRWHASFKASFKLRTWQTSNKPRKTLELTF